MLSCCPRKCRWRSVCGCLVGALAVLVGLIVSHGIFEGKRPHPALPSAPALVPNFEKCVAEKRRKALQNCGSRCDVVLVGDSILEGLASEYCYHQVSGISWCGPAYCPLENDEGGRAFREAFPAHEKSLIVAGAGDETQHTLYVLDAVLPVLRAPKVFVLMIGTNNIPAYSMPGNVSLPFEGIVAVVKRLRDAHAESKVLLHAIMPRADDSPGGFNHWIPSPNKPWAHRVIELNQELATWASTQGPAVQFINCSGVFPMPDEGMQELMPDFLHPNGAGYIRWFKCWEKEMQEALQAA